MAHQNHSILEIIIYTVHAIRFIDTLNEKH